MASSPPLAGAGAAAFGARYFAGSAANFARQPAEQKWNTLPPCSMRCFEVAGSTFIPHTGSITRAVAPASCVGAWWCPASAWWSWC